VKQPLLARVIFDKRNLLFSSSSQPQVLQGLFIDRKNSAGCAVLRRHICDRCSIRKRQVAKPWSKVFDEFPDNTMLAEHLRNRQN
jgi:hypothetical protein